MRPLRRAIRRRSTSTAPWAGRCPIRPFQIFPQADSLGHIWLGILKYSAFRLKNHRGVESSSLPIGGFKGYSGSMADLALTKFFRRHLNAYSAISSFRWLTAELLTENLGGFLDTRRCFVRGGHRQTGSCGSGRACWQRSASPGRIHQVA